MSLDPLRCTNYLPGGLTLEQADKSREMLCMCRKAGGGGGGGGGRSSMVYVGLRSGVVQAFDCSERRFTAQCDTTGGVGTLVGVAKYERYRLHPHSLTHSLLLTHSSLTPPHSLLLTHSSSLTPPHSLLLTHSSSLTHSSLTPHSLTPPHSLLLTHSSSLTPHSLLLTHSLLAPSSGPW